jgi:gas vesicle protein
MTEPTSLSRRDFGAAAAAAAALAAAPAAAQPLRRAGPEWYRAIQEHHRQLFDLMGRAMDGAGGRPAALVPLIRRINMVNATHSIAEEVSIYPMIDILGMRDRSESLYREQQMAKVMGTRMLIQAQQGDPGLRDTMRQLSDALRAHVREEEDQTYPDLVRRASPAQNRMISEMYSETFRRASA